MKVYSITHKPIKNLERLGLIPVGVGLNQFPKNYIIDNTENNIAYKNENYGEITFHYWFWKNLIDQNLNNEWFGICHYRRFFVNLKYQNQIKNTDGKQGFLDNNLDIGRLKNMIQKEPAPEWKNKDVVLCEPSGVSGAKKMKIIKRGFKSLIRDPSILFNKNKHTLKLHFDMFHGFGNLDKAISQLPQKDKSDFKEYVSSKTSLSTNCMYMSNKTEIVKNFYEDLFEWLFKCEKIFGLTDLKGYGLQRIYTFLTERYMPFWFEKYSKVGYWPWVFTDISKIKD